MVELPLKHTSPHLTIAFLVILERLPFALNLWRHNLELTTQLKTLGRHTLRNGTTPTYVGPRLAELYRRAGGETAWAQRDTDEHEDGNERLPLRHPGAPAAKRARKK